MFVTFVIKEFAMKDRLLQLLDLEQITPSKFADIIGVQRSSVSHVISGRNKPSYDFLQKTLKAFPGLNASWLLLGEGTMYEQMGRKVPVNLFDPPEVQSDEQNPDEIPEEIPEKENILPSPEPSVSTFQESSPPETLVDTAAEHDSGSSGHLPGQKPEESKKIIQVLVIYEDDTFKTIHPAH